VSTQNVAKIAIQEKVHLVSSRLQPRRKYADTTPDLAGAVLVAATSGITVAVPCSLGSHLPRPQVLGNPETDGSNPSPATDYGIGTTTQKGMRFLFRWLRD